MKNTRHTEKKNTNKHAHRYVFVFGGVMSGVGKGIATASLGLLFEAKGYKVRPIKIDPYLNVDAGTMNPVEHGEVFVLNNGLETDQDMGNYERFINRDLASYDYMTSGMVYKHVIEKERSLGYGGKTVEAIPHIRDEIIDRIEYKPDNKASSGFDITLVEVGGTVGDFQNALFIEAARVMRLRHPHAVQFILVSYLPVPSALGEMKTRPTQHAVRELNSYGVAPDFIIARAPVSLDDKRKEKIAIATNVPVESVISAPDIDSIYDVPLNFEKDAFADLLLERFDLPIKKQSTGLSKWKSFVKNIHNQKEYIKNGGKPYRVAVVGKYFETGSFSLSDAYVSVIEAVKFSSAHTNTPVELVWINSTEFEKNGVGDKKMCSAKLKNFDGIIVPGGFGARGVEGIISAIQYAREHKIPYLGLCYGMQLAVIEYARNVVGLKGAHTKEVDKNTKYPVVDVMEQQKEVISKGKLGGSMRLGAYTALIKPDTIAHEMYTKMAMGGQRIDKNGRISERHRHRYEVHPEYMAQIEKKGLVFSGTSPDGLLMEIAELPKSKHPYFVATQFHPEFLARPLDPHPLFSGFISALNKYRK